MSGYFLLKGDNAYDIAKDVLEQRYGSSFAISEAFRDKLDNWPRVQAKDARALRRLSDFLNQCESAMTDIKGLEILNDNRENRKILRKLPRAYVTGEGNGPFAVQTQLGWSIVGVLKHQRC